MFKDTLFMNNNAKNIIGFDKLIDHILETQIAKPSNYPPYNLYKNKENYIIEMAVAGFAQEDLDIEVTAEKLIISGKRTPPEQDEYLEALHAGLAFRAFKQSFTISESIKVGTASLKDGVLTLKLDIVIPEEKKPRKIKIAV